MNKNKIKKHPTLAGLCIFMVFAALGMLLAYNDSLASTSEKALESLEEKKQKYETLIDLKQRQGQTLNNQLEMMDLQMKSFENDISSLEKEVLRNAIEIEKISGIVEKRQQELNKQRVSLAEMIRFIYQTGTELSVASIGKEMGISAVMEQTEYINQASAKMEKLIDETKKKKKAVDEKRTKLEEKKDELSENKKKFEEKVDYLSTEKKAKSTLLQQTQGQENQYKKLLTRVDKQMQELIGDLDSLSSDVRDALDDIIKKAPKPKKGLASKKWHYLQDDKDWGYKRIGLSNTLMKDYGCAVTALAMVFTYHDEDITPGRLSGKPIFSRDLIVWPDEWKGLELNSSRGHVGVDWKRVDKEIKDDNPVIVFIRSRTGAGHYVVVHGKDKNGKYVVHDPLFGANIYLDTTRKLVGRIYNSSTTVDQMLIYEK